MAPARIRFDEKSFRWKGVEPRAYRDTRGEEPGMTFRGVARHVLAGGQELPAEFELRYFEFEPGGYSCLEKHRHAHFVIALRGRGRALVGEDVIELRPYDAVYIAPHTPHRWMNSGQQPFGFLCPVDSSRDWPQPLDEREWEALRANPLTAPYVF
jgi:quercetin dioxygenase-like cupin family protein